MSDRLVHDMDVAWTSSDPIVLETGVEAVLPLFVEGAGSNRFTAHAGAATETATLTFGPPIDLGAFDELRFWIHSSRRASGSPAAPFFLEFSYTDAADLPGEQHRWFVPVNEAGKWEHRRIGVENDRRTAVNRMQFRSLTNAPFVCRVDELLAVREEMLADVERQLTARLASIAIPGLTALPLTAPANGGNQVVIAPAPEFEAGNQVLVAGGSLGGEIREVTAVNHQSSNTRLTVAPTLAGNFPAGTSTVSLHVPAIVELGTTPAPATPLPAIVLTPLDAHEDLERTGYVAQRDSFRLRGALTVCSVRASARAYTVDYQLVVRARRRTQQLVVHTTLLGRLRSDVPLRINGVLSPVTVLPAPAIEDRELGILSAMYVRIGTRMETAPRVEQPWVVQAEARSAPLDAPLDQEGIVIRL